MFFIDKKNDSAGTNDVGPLAIIEGMPVAEPLKSDS